MEASKTRPARIRRVKMKSGGADLVIFSNDNQVEYTPEDIDIFIKEKVLEFLSEIDQHQGFPISAAAVVFMGEGIDQGVTYITSMSQNIRYDLIPKLVSDYIQAHVDYFKEDEDIQP